MEAISPVVRGLINGFSLGNMVQQQQMDQRRMANQEKQQQFENESRQANLLSQLAELGARPMSQGDQFEVQGGTHVNFNEGLPIEGGPSITSTPTDLPARMLSMPGTGQQFVLPSAGERDQRAQTMNQRTLLDRNRAAADAHAKLLEQNAAAAAANLEQTGITLPKSLLDRFGMKPGTKVSAGQMDDLVRADSYAQQVNRPAAKTVVNTYRFQGPKGMVERKVYKDGTFDETPINGTQLPTRSGGGAGKGRTAAAPKPTFTQTVEALTNKVLEDSAAGGGATVDDALKNVDAYYKNDPQFSGAIRQQVKSRLRKIGDKSGGANPLAGKVQPKATAAPANPYR